MTKQFLKFGLIGFTSGAVNFLVYNAGLWILRSLHLMPKNDYLLAQLLGFLVSVLWGFLLNRKYVFNSKAEQEIVWYRALIKMYLVYSVTGIGLNAILSTVWVRVFIIPKEILTIINDLLAFPINFLLNKFWSFRAKK